MIEREYLGITYQLPLHDNGGMIDGAARSTDRDSTLAALLDAGLILPVYEPITDPETGEVTWESTGEIDYDSNGHPIEADGVEVVFLGNLVLTEGTYDEDGNELTPPVIDTHDSINFRMTGHSLEIESEVTPGELKWVETAVLWSLYGSPDPVQNKNEVGVVYGESSLIEPDTIISLKNVWL